MPYLSPPGTTISGLTTGQYVVAASSSSLATDGVKRYVALLTQSGTDAPVATVLENSLGGTVVWTRSGRGIYAGTLGGAFIANKTIVMFNLNYDLSTSDESSNISMGSVSRLSDNVLTVSSGNAIMATPVFTLGDDLINGAMIEVAVYP